MRTVLRPRDPTGTQAERQPGSKQWLWVVGLVVVALLAAGVVAVLAGGSEEPEVGLPPPPATSAPAPTEADRVLSAYRNAVKAGDEAMAIPDPDYPLLFAYTTNPQLDGLRASIRNFRENGLAMRAPADSASDQRPKVVSIDGDRARLESCELEDGYMVRISDDQPMGIDAKGQIVPADPGGRKNTHLFAVEMVRDQGAWKLSRITPQQKWEGVAGCWVGQ